MTTAAVAAYIAYENAYRSPNGITPMVAGQNVFDLADIEAAGNSKTFTTGYNAVVLDGARSLYDVQVNASGLTTILDLTNGQTVALTGEAYLLFDGNNLASHVIMASGAPVYSNDAFFVLNPSDAQVAELYAAVLQRQPDMGGLEYWLGRLASGFSLTAIAQSFLNAAHSATSLQTLFGGDPSTMTPTQFVNALYQNVLGRVPDASGLAYWISQLSSGSNSQATVLASFTNASANLASANVTAGATPSADTGWLANYAVTGGVADVGAKESASAVLAQSASTGYVNTALIDISTLGANGAITGGGVSIYTTTSSGVTFTPIAAQGNNITIALSTGIKTASAYGNNDTLYAPTAGGANIQIYGSSDTVYLSGTGNMVTSIGTTALVIGWNGTDVVQVGNSSVNHSGQIFVANAVSPLQGSSLNFQVNASGTTYTAVINIGSVGTGSAADVAAAANKAYVPTGGFGESVIFMGANGNGDTVLYMWGSLTHNAQGLGANQGDTNGNHMVDAAELSAGVTLVGVAASSLTLANFH